MNTKITVDDQIEPTTVCLNCGRRYFLGEEECPVCRVPETFTPLPNFIVPPEFWPAFGFESQACHAAIYWTPFGDEAMANDGRMGGTMDWMAYLMLVEHPPNAKLLRCPCSECPGRGGPSINYGTILAVGVGEWEAWLTTWVPAIPRLLIGWLWIAEQIPRRSG